MPIKKLHHQDYDGKRVFIEISDNFGNVFPTKLDIGVHKDMDIDQFKPIISCHTDHRFEFVIVKDRL